MTAAGSPGGVQSVGRALDLLERIAAAGGDATLSEIAAAAELPLPTIHRLARTLVDRGYLRQLPNRRYALGPRLIPLGEMASSAVGIRARPVLAGLVEQLGESANLATLDGDMIVYTSQVPSQHAMRMFTEVGRRVLPHCTAVGKALLARFPDAQVAALLNRTGMPAQTPNTITDAGQFLTQLRAVRRDGYAMDEGEQEIGVRCVAVAVPTAAARLGVSVSGPGPRMTRALVRRAIPLLHQASQTLADDLADLAS